MNPGGPDDRLRHLLTSYQECRTVMAGVRLGVFTALAGHPAAAAEVAARLDLPVETLTLLLDALAAMELLEKRDGRYRATADAARLLADGDPDSLAALVRHQDRMWERWTRLEEKVRGRAVEPDAAEDLRDFVGAMAANGRRGARRAVEVIDLSGARRVLDLGGGPGSYAAAFARRWPHLEVTLFDHEETVEVARRHLVAEGVADRVRIVGGDLFSGAIGEGYDAIWASNLVHSYPRGEVREILAVCRRALVPGGRLLLHDFFLEADGTRPRRAAVFSLHMLVVSRGGRSYTWDEMEAMLAAGGFGGFLRRPATEASGILTAVRTPP